MNSTKSSANLDVLRSIAVLLVVCCHLSQFSGNPVFWIFEFGLIGKVGVLFFFVHTCLVLMHSLERQERRYGKRHLFWTFIVRRVFRIFPLSIFVIGAICLLHIPSDHIIYHDVVWHNLSPLSIAANLLLMQNCLHNGSILGPLWSLPYEMQMYLVLPALYLFARRTRTTDRLIMMWGAFTFAFIVLGPHLPPFNYHGGVFETPDLLQYIPCFLPGVAAYVVRADEEGKWPFGWLLALLAGICIAWMVSYDVNRGPVLCLILGLSLPRFAEVRSVLIRKSSALIARYSYGIYLTHYFCIWAVFTRLHYLPGLAKWALFACLLMGIPVLLYHLIESPMIRLGNRIVNRLHAGRTQHVEGILAVESACG